MENEFSKLNMGEMKIMAALSKYKFPSPVYNFLHDTLAGCDNVPKYMFHGRLIYTVVISSGLNSAEMSESAKSESIVVTDVAEQMIASKNFSILKDTISILVIVPGSLFSEYSRTTKAFRRKGYELSLHNASDESAFLLRSKFTNIDLEDMYLTKIVVAHKALKDFNGKNRLLCASIYNGEFKSITARIDNPDNTWQRDAGFAFEALRFKGKE